MTNNFYLGIVEDRISDPLKLGRVKVRVFGVHSESLIDVPVEDLPWAIPLMSASSASLSGIGDAVPQYVEGTTVFLFFQDGDSKQQPIILGSLAGIPLNKNPLSNITEEISSSISAPRSKVISTSPGTLVDSSGKSVLDSSGTPVQTPTSTTDLVPPLDITDMVAKYGDNVTLVYKTLLDFGIKDPYALIAILSNVAKECSFKVTRESLKYTTTARLKAIFPSYFNKLPDSEVANYIGNEQKIANYVYASRYGNSDTASGDGYNFRGGGFIQLTFKSNYRDVGSKIGVDLVSDPSQISDPKIAAKTCAQYFINSFGGRGKLSFSNLDEALTAVTKKVNPGGFANDYPKVVTNSKLCKIIDDTAPTEKQKTEEIAKPNEPTNDVNTSATQTQIDTGTASKNRVSGATGFKDPSGKYPLEVMLKEQDNSRLARRNISNTSVDKRNANRVIGIKNIAGSTFDEPAPAYNAQYPYNKVHTTESGHTVEFDDTPGNERISQFHTSGTYSEVDKYGNLVNKIVGDQFSITERNGYIYIDGTARISVGSDVKLYVAGNMDVEVDGDLNYNVGGSVNWKIGGSLIQGVGGQNSMRSGSSTDIDSSMINLNSGSSASNPVSARGPSVTDYPRRIPENFLGAETIRFDDVDSEDPVAVKAAEKKQIESGAVTQQELDKGTEAAAKPAAVDKEDPPAKDAPIETSCSIFENKDDIPDTTQISKYFTIGMLSSNAIVSHYKIGAQHGLTKAQLACNLKHLAENCLDKIKAQYPNMKVTSAFRGNSGSTSQHERGMAADMQFDGALKGEYFTIAQWIKTNITFDQLLLEYKTTGTGNPWIHISFNQDGCRNQVLTLMNNKTAGPGLLKLEG
jgi:predicted chitinase